MLITGGDLTVGGVKNYSNNKVEVFNPMNNTLTASGQMNYARWYPSIITLCNGDKLLLGGTVSPDVRALTPEVFQCNNWLENPARDIGRRGDRVVLPKGLLWVRWQVMLLRYRLRHNSQAQYRRQRNHPGYGIANGRGGVLFSVSECSPLSRC